MDKKAAAEYLGISTRALEYHVTQGHIGRRMVKGKTGDVADFNEPELRKLKAQLEEKRAPRASVVRDESPEDEPRSLARLSDVSPPQMVRLISEVFATLIKETKAAPPVIPIANKLTLSLAEAAELAGLSKNFLRDAIHKKTLKAVIRGRGFNIKRADLDAYIKKL